MVWHVGDISPADFCLLLKYMMWNLRFMLLTRNEQEKSLREKEFCYPCEDD